MTAMRRVSVYLLGADEPVARTQMTPDEIRALADTLRDRDGVVELYDATAGRQVIIPVSGVANVFVYDRGVDQ